MIVFNDVCFAYEDIVALSHVSFEIAAGEAVLLRGPNGSGKSTVLKIMNGLIYPERGTYCFEGTPIDKNTTKDAVFTKQFHQKIGYLFQNVDSQLFCNCVEDEVAFGLIQMGKDEAEIKKRVDDMLALLGIEKLRHRPPYHLSGGEKKKTALASILAVNPKVLVLDEPISGLDKESQQWMIEFLMQMKNAGKTIVIATHSEELFWEFANREISIPSIAVY